MPDEQQPKLFDLVVPCQAHDFIGLSVEKTRDGTRIRVYVFKEVDHLELDASGVVQRKAA